MYKYEAGLVLQVRAGNSYESMDLENELVYNIFNRYYKAYLTLSNPAASGPIYVDMMSLRRYLGAFTGTVKEWLVLNGNNTIPSIPELPVINLRTATYGEMTRSGYNVTFANEGYYYQQPMDRALFKDLSINRDNTVMKDIYDTALISINGFIHDCSHDTRNLYVREGGTTVKFTDTYTIGQINFQPMGTLKRHRLVRTDITAFDNGSPLKAKMRIKVPDYEENRIFALVMGGYLIFPEDGIFYYVGNQEFGLDIQKLDYIERLLESSRFINLKDLNLEQPIGMSQEGWFTDQALSDEVLRNYLTLSQSFFVSFSVDNMNVIRQPIGNEPYPGCYLDNPEPTEPLMGGWGRLIEYWPIEGKQEWVINAKDTFRRFYLASQSGLAGQLPKVVDQTPDVTQRDRLTAGYFLQIQSKV